MTIALAFLVLAPVNQGPQLLGADEVLKRLKAREAARAAELARLPIYRGDPSGLPPSYLKREELTKQAKQFYSELPTLEPNVAASRWLKLFDDLIMFGGNLSEVITVLPPTNSWPAIQQGIEVRMANKTSLRSAAFRLFGSLLGENREAQEEALRISLTIANKSPVGNRSSSLESLDDISLKLALRHGDVSLLKETLLRAVNDPNRRLNLEDSMLDLLGAEKEAFLIELMQKAKCNLRYFSYYSDTPNGKLLYKLALQSAEKHQAPLWGLAERMDNIELYEAIAKRFNSFKSWPLTGKKPGAEDFPGMHSSSNGLLARSFYLVSLAKAGNLVKAVKGAGDGTSLTDDFDFRMDRQPSPKVNEFMRRVLIAHPKSDWWSQYETSALALGRFEELLASTGTALDFPKLGDKHRKTILKTRESAFLALDRVDEAIATMKKRMALDLKDRNSSSSEEAIYRMEKLANLLGRKEFSKEVENHFRNEKYKSDRMNRVEKDLAKREAAIATSDQDSYSLRYTFVGAELISIYSAANRPADVIKIAEAEGGFPTIAQIRADF